MDEKELFKEHFYTCADLLKNRYTNKEGQERDILGHIINNFMEELQHDLKRMNFKDFYHKYLKNTLFYDCNDFTNSEIINIINESPLNDRDKLLSRLYWVDNKVEQEIADTLGVDIKTIRRNIPKISQILKQTCAKIFN